MTRGSAILIYDSSLISSQPLSGGKLQPTVITTLRSQQQNVPTVHPREAGSINHESPCIAAVGKRTNNSDNESTSDQLSNDAAIKLESDGEPNLITKVESAGMTDLSPSKPGKSKL